MNSMRSLTRHLLYKYKLITCLFGINKTVWSILKHKHNINLSNIIIMKYNLGHFYLYVNIMNQILD